MIIKVLLIAGALAFGFLLLRRPGLANQSATLRILGSLVVLAGIFAVLFPLTVTDVANAVGVGRGTDLVLYVSVMVFLFVAVSLFQRVHDLDVQITELTRQLALLTARRASEEAGTPADEQTPQVDE
jgi:hypothetical protein